MRGILLGKLGSLAAFGALGALGVVVWGCSSAGSTPAPTSIRLELVGNGQQVSLKGSPFNAAYQANYPVTQVDRMVVTILATGDIVAACQSGGTYSDCSDQPFFTNVTRSGTSSHIQVYDLFGVKIADQVSCNGVSVADQITCVPGPDGGCGTTTGGEPPEYLPDSGTGTGGGGGGGSGGMCPGDDGGTGGGGGGGGSGDGGGTTDGGSGGDNPQCDASAIAQEQAQFCAAVDQWLTDHGITNYQVDCSQLNGTFNYSGAEPPEVHQDIPCMEEIKEAWDQAWATLGTCDAAVQGIVMNWKSSSRWLLIQNGTCRGSPLVLDLDGNGVELGSLDTGVAFDLFGTGEKMKTAWIKDGDGLLFLDRNGNGKVDGAAELFGTRTGGRAFDDGFQALSELDANQDGRVDARDPAFAELTVWRDKNHDGKSQPMELTRVTEAGIRALLVGAVRGDERSSFDKNGNQIPLTGSFIKDDGQAGLMVDAYLRFQPLR